MRKVRKIALWTLAVLLLLPVVLVAAVLIALNTSPGRGFAERTLASVTGGMVVLQGLEGRFPDSLRLKHLEVHDATGAWLLADDVALDWSPTALLHKQALVHRLDAARLQLPRLPASAPATPAPAEPSQPFTLPVRVTVEHLAIAQADLGAPVAGTAASLALTGQADLPSLETGTATITAKRLQAGTPDAGTYTLVAAVTAQTIDATLKVAEPANGLIANIASLPNLGPLALDAAIAGPTNALATTLALTAGPLKAAAKGTIDLPGSKAALDVTASAPAMEPAPGVSWRTIALNAHVAGPFTTPDATGTLRIEALEAAGATIRTLAADLAGNAGQVTLKATAEALRIPGPSPGLLEAAPLRLDATARLDDPARPVTFTLAHPLIAAQGTAKTGGDLVVDTTLGLPNLAPFAAIGGVEAAGRTQLTIHAAQANGVIAVTTDGTIGLTAGPAPAPALIGPDAKLGLTAQLAGNDVTITRLTLAGAALTLNATGTSKPAGLDVTARLALANLALLAPTLTGATQLDAHVTGPLDKLALDATLAGDIGAPGVPRGPVRLVANLTGLPAAPAGRITGEGVLAGAPLQLALDAARAADGTLTATINRADWRSFHAEGALTLAPGSTLPVGRVALRMPKLDDLRPLIGQPIGGALTATIQLDPTAVILDAEATNAGIPGNQVARAVVKARVSDPLTRPVVAATITADGIAAGGATGNARIEAAGPQDALSIKTTTALNASGTDAQITGAALLDAVKKQVTVQTLSVTATNAQVKNETVRLLAPATITFGNGVAVDRLRLGVRQAVLDVAGKLSPALDATVTLRTPADIAAMVAPALAADGAIALDAKLTGSPARPGGTVKLTATGIRLRTGPGRAAPAANLTANVQLEGASAKLDARFVAGTANVAIAGQAPLGAGALNLRATGALDLALLDPILTAAGRRARGRLSLDAAITGTAAAPSIAGTAQLAGGEIQDFTQGVRITDLAGTFRAAGETLRIEGLTGRAGPGTIAVAGSVGILAPTLPVDLTITMRNARPLASDLITADLDTDITIRGPATGGLQIGGRIKIQKAELRVPKTLPASVVTLNVRRPGDKPAVPAAPGTPIALDLTIDAPNSIFLRGRGIDAEMGGTLRIRGTSTSPQVGGNLAMRRGSISVAGTTLNFSRGKIGFDGTGVSGKIDPTLDFAADSTAGGVTATLAIGGYVSKPKITLSSVPDLPQDEVLAYLIFKRSAKELGPFQIAEIAAAVAELTGVGGDGGLNPLESVRKGLGLDRLSLGAGAKTNSAPTVEAGRYVANGVYVGAKQGTTGGQTQATVQVDITKGLKLQADVGAGTGGNQVGVTYQFEY